MGSITVAFTDNGFMNLKGQDLYIFEVGPSREEASIEISENGIQWIDVGKVAGGKTSIELSDFDIDSRIVFKYIRITDTGSVCKSKTAGADIDAVAAINSVIKLDVNADVLFNIADYKIRTEALSILKNFAKTIQKIDKATIRIEGHTDSDGTLSYNQTLSENRCTSVKKTLTSILENTHYDYEIKAFGETKPKVKNSSKSNKQRNRRVEITVLPPKEYYNSITN